VPQVDYDKQLGTDKLGAGFGVHLENRLTLDIDDLAGSFEVGCPNVGGEGCAGEAAAAAAAAWTQHNLLLPCASSGWLATTLSPYFRELIVPSYSILGSTHTPTHGNRSSAVIAMRIVIELPWQPSPPFDRNGIETYL